jgi:hypothetical protein
MADQLHLAHQYKNQFQDIDFVVLGLKYENDLKRSFIIQIKTEWSIN